MKIGNWLIEENGIAWDGKTKVDYFIPTEKVLQLGPGNRSNMYDWLVHLQEKTWISKIDLYEFNISFIILIEMNGLELDLSHFSESLKEQQKN